jgi:hypothetical protein
VFIPDKDDAMITLGEGGLFGVAMLPEAVPEIVGYADVEGCAALIGQDIDEVVVIHWSSGRILQSLNV